MAAIKVLNMKGAEVGEIELNDNVFGVEYKESLIHQAVVTRLANERQGLIPPPRTSVLVRVDFVPCLSFARRVTTA